MRIAMKIFQKHRGAILFWTGAFAALAAGWQGFPVVRYARLPQPVDFSHQIHADKAGAKCEDCHSLRPDGSFAGLPALDKCSGCHAQPMGTSVAEKHFIDAYAAPNREIPWRIAARQPQNVYFSHVFHIKLAHLDCRACHGRVGESQALQAVPVERISGYSGAPEFQRMEACQSCHRQRGAQQSCLSCHK